MMHNISISKGCDSIFNLRMPPASRIAYLAAIHTDKTLPSSLRGSHQETRWHRWPASRSAFPAVEFVEAFRTLLSPLLSSYPELLPILHNVGKYSTTEEHHVLPTWRVFNADLEFLFCSGLSTERAPLAMGTHVETTRVTPKNSSKVKLLHLLLQSAW